FAQLTWRESLRDIEACLRAHSTKLYHLGIRGNVARNTLANANARRDWRIYCDFAQRLIGIARGLYAEEPLGIELKDTVYALDSTTIDLCLSVFSWAPFRSTKAAVKLHTLLDLGRNPRLSSLATASSTTSTSSTISCLNPAPSTSWTELISTSSVWPGSTTPAAFSLHAPSPTSEHSVATRTPLTEPRGSSATRPWCSRAFTRAKALNHRCAGSSSMTP